MMDRRTIFNILVYAQFVALVLLLILIFVDPFDVYSSQFADRFKILAKAYDNIYDPEYGKIYNLSSILAFILYIVSLIGLRTRNKYSIYLFSSIWMFGILFYLIGPETVTYDDKYVSALDTILVAIDGAILVMATLFSKEVGFLAENER